MFSNRELAGLRSICDAHEKRIGKLEEQVDRLIEKLNFQEQKENQYLQLLLAEYNQLSGRVMSHYGYNKFSTGGFDRYESIESIQKEVIRLKAIAYDKCREAGECQSTKRRSRK